MGSGPDANCSNECMVPVITSSVIVPSLWMLVMVKPDAISDDGRESTCQVSRSAQNGSRQYATFKEKKHKIARPDAKVKGRGVDDTLTQTPNKMEIKKTILGRG